MRIPVVIALLVALCMSACDAPPAEMAVVVPEIAREELVRQPAGSHLILDVRTPEEYAAGHVGNALNIPHDQLAERVSEIQRFSEVPVVVYCKSGRRAALAAEVLSQAGFTQLSHLTGDMDGWLASGYPVSTTAP